MKFLLLLPLLLITAIAPAHADKKKFRTPTKLDAALAKNGEYQSELNFFKMRMDRRGYDPYVAIYRPEVYAARDRANARERFVASYYVLKDHSVREIKRAIVDEIEYEDENGEIVNDVDYASPELFARNSILFRRGMRKVRKKLIGDIQSAHQLGKVDAAREVDKMFAFLDIQGATETKNGMGFFGEFISTFKASEWVDFALELEKRLDHLISEGIETHLTLYDIAVDVARSHRNAVKLLGLIMARDIDMIDYFDYMENPPDQDAIDRMTRIPKLVRAYTDWLQWRNRAESDTFSFPGKIESLAVKNHYFWTEAYLMQQLLDAKMDPAVASTLCTRLLADYQDYRVTVSSTLERARWDVWLGLAFSTGATLGYKILDQIFGDGTGALSPYVWIGGSALGVRMGERITRKQRLKAQSSPLQVENDVNMKLAMTASQFALETWEIQACEDTWAPILEP